MDVERDDAAEYCRRIEAHLCRKNDGHLIRIVGPAFEQVCGWARRGVPLKVACRGIDRYFERYYAKGPRRRPVRVDFCEADVLDVFDEWRRAVGVTPAATAGAGADLPFDVAQGPRAESSGQVGPARRPASLPAHLERIVARLTALRAGEDRSLDGTIEALVREVDAARAGARSLRGDARGQLIARLRELDAMLIDAARSGCDPSLLRELQGEADAELSPFRERMPRAAYEASRRACVDRLVRERHRLPILTFE